MGISFGAPYDGDPDPTLPLAATIDRRITPASLALYEPSHSTNPLVGIPATGTIFKNIAAASADAIIGASTDTDATFTHATPDDTKLRFLRTGAGGLQCVSSASARGGKVARLKPNSGLMTWINSAEHRGDAYSLFVWLQVTRAAASSANLVELLYGNNVGSSANNLYSAAIENTLGFKRISINRGTGWTGTPNSDAVQNDGGIWFGNSNPYASLNTANGKSYNFYSYHLVHRPTTGVSHTEADEQDLEAFNEAFGPGGRFYEDVFAPPSSIIAV